LKLSKIVLIIGCTYVISITIGCITVIAIPMILNYTLYNFILFGISWLIIWGVWCYNVSVSVNYFPGYYFITCYHLKLRLISIEKRLRNFIDHSDHLSLRGSLLTIRKILEDHNSLCQQINIYNMFWRKYLTTTYCIFLLLISFLSYTVFFFSYKMVCTYGIFSCIIFSYITYNYYNLFCIYCFALKSYSISWIEFNLC
jgi:hypothetical protein